MLVLLRKVRLLAKGKNLNNWKSMSWNQGGTIKKKLFIDWSVELHNRLRYLQLAEHIFNDQRQLAVLFQGKTTVSVTSYITIPNTIKSKIFKNFENLRSLNLPKLWMFYHLTEQLRIVLDIFIYFCKYGAHLYNIHG